MQEISAVLHCLVLNPDARLIQINLGYPLSPLHDSRHRSRQIRRPAAQSKLRSSAQGLLRLLCASNAQKMQINRDSVEPDIAYLGIKKGSHLLSR